MSTRSVRVTALVCAAALFAFALPAAAAPGDTGLVSRNSAGAIGNGRSDLSSTASASAHGAISSDGRYVAFESAASNLVAGDTNGFRDVFVRDRQTGATEFREPLTKGAPCCCPHVPFV